MQIAARNIVLSVATLLGTLLLTEHLFIASACAQNNRGSITKMRSAFDMFSKKFNTRSGVFDPVSLNDEPLQEGDSYEAEVKSETQAAQKQQKQEDASKEHGLEESLRYYDANDPTKDKIRPAHERSSVRVMPDAPAPARGMIASYRSGDMKLAGDYAGQLVRMQKDYFFEIRQITKLIGEALVRENVIDGADWLGAEQMLEIEMARTRKEMNTLLKPDHDSAMKRIVPDEKGKATAFYFFSMQCSWCRYMAPDIERLHQIAKADPNFDLHLLTIGQAPKLWIDEYKSYTGITAEIMDGEDLARKFNIGFVPALIVVSPTANRSYLKTGQQSFSRMYQFVQRVQGKDAKLTPAIRALIERPIGQRELEFARKHGTQAVVTNAKTSTTTRQAKRVEVATF